MKLVPERGNKVFIISEEDLLLKMMREVDWYMDDNVRIKVVKEYAGKIVICSSSEPKYDYLFTVEGPTFHFNMIDIKRTINELS